MAEIIDFTTELIKSFEPKRQRWFTLSIDGGPDAFTIFASKRPSFNFDEVVLDVVNQKSFFPGKFTPDDLPITFYDPIEISAAQKVMQWVHLCFEMSTGRSGYKSWYARNIIIKMLCPVGSVIEKWRLRNAWLKGFDGGEISWASNELANLSCTVRYDTPILEF